MMILFFGFLDGHLDSTVTQGVLQPVWTDVVGGENVTAIRSLKANVGETELLGHRTGNKIHFYWFHDDWGI